MQTISASEAGAHLDCDILRGGGTDDTAVLQAVLDQARDGTPIKLILDGVALVTGLDLHGRTTIEGAEGAGLFLKDGSARAIVRNANRSRGTIIDEHITVRNCFLNGNRLHQPSADIRRPDIPEFDGPSNKEPDGTYLSGLQFLGVNFLTIENVVLWNVRAFGALIGNAARVTIRNVTVDHGAPDNAVFSDIVMTDGLHFKGPLRNVTIDNVTFRTGDDALAFNANDYETNDVTTRNDFGPYVGQGSITDVCVNNVHLIDVFRGIRLLSSNERIDRIVFSNIVGTVKDGYVFTLDHWQNRESAGNFGTVMFDNLNVRRTEPDPGCPCFRLDACIESLLLRNVAVAIDEEQQVLWIGQDTCARIISGDVTVHGSNGRAMPVQLDPGGRVERFDLTLTSVERSPS